MSYSYKTAYSLYLKLVFLDTPWWSTNKKFALWLMYIHFTLCVLWLLLWEFCNLPFLEVTIHTQIHAHAHTCVHVSVSTHTHTQRKRDINPIVIFVYISHIFLLENSPVPYVILILFRMCGRWEFFSQQIDTIVLSVPTDWVEEWLLLQENIKMRHKTDLVSNQN